MLQNVGGWGSNLPLEYLLPNRWSRRQILILKKLAARATLLASCVTASVPKQDAVTEMRLW
jgi:hypothetical protein